MVVNVPEPFGVLECPVFWFVKFRVMLSPGSACPFPLPFESSTVKEGIFSTGEFSSNVKLYVHTESFASVSVKVKVAGC